MFKFIKKIIKYSVLLTILVVVLPTVIIELYSFNKTYTERTSIPKNKVGLVLGTSKFLKGGAINLFYKYRIDAAVELYQAGKIEYILVSGDNRHKSYNEPARFLQDLIKRGIPSNKIILDYAGFRTLDSVMRAHHVFSQNKITIISQEFHNERAIFLGFTDGMEAIGYNAKDPEGQGEEKVRIRELFARGKVFYDLVFNVKPKFLGKEKITIE
ncbi:MAG: vancomycin high temperature exclusion protein [Cyclobacteriaceae bacterium]